MSKPEDISDTISQERIIALAGWYLSSDDGNFHAADPKGDVAKALTKNGFRAGELTDKFLFKKTDSSSAGGMGAMISGTSVIILPETKKILDNMCSTDISQPDPSKITQPIIKTAVVPAVEQASAGAASR